MDAVKFLKEKGRMCEITYCRDCKLAFNNNGTNLSCTYFGKNNPERTVEIVEEWSKNNPKKTYKDVLLEKFPNAMLFESGTPKTCARSIFGDSSVNCCDADTCSSCWNREYKED